VGRLEQANIARRDHIARYNAKHYLISRCDHRWGGEGEGIRTISGEVLGHDNKRGGGYVGGKLHPFLLETSS